MYPDFQYIGFHEQSDRVSFLEGKAYGTLTDIQVAAMRWSGNGELQWKVSVFELYLLKL